ncbi:MAG TPA: phage integrase SAM-like domain-containing protein [Flavisolibacter sp.]
MCKSAYNTEIKNGRPLPGTIKKYLDAFINQNEASVKSDQPTLYELIDRFISGEIKKAGKRGGGRDKSKGTLNNYQTAKQHLQAFEQRKRYRIDFDTITLEFFNSYVDFLQKTFVQKTKDASGNDIVGLSHNSIAKDIRMLKIFMNKAVGLGYTGNLAFKHEDFTYSEEATDAVYLKEAEISKLFRYKPTSEKLENVKDMFVFGCLVGLRFSDYSNVKPENIIDEDGELFLKIKTQKTGELVYIPCHPIVLQIFYKYGRNTNRLPKSISNQKFNEYIKEVCKAANFDQAGRLTTHPEKLLYECISSHTARRSFATNLFLEGFPVMEIMKITGHTTEKAFMKYIRVSKLDSAKRLNAHMKEMWNKKLLKVAM